MNSYCILLYVILHKGYFMSKIYNCNFLNSGLHFLSNNLRFCSAPAHDGPNISSKHPGTKDVISSLLKIRQHAINDMKKHIAPRQCEGCIYLKEYDLDSPFLSIDDLEMQNSEPLISNIVIDHFQQCNCYCIYCFIRKETKIITSEPKRSDYYDLYPIIEYLYKEKLIDTENLQVEFNGGDVSVLKEFPDLLDIFLKNNVKSLVISTNAIKFLPEIVEASKKTDVKLITSVDAGSRQVFKRIRILDKFDDVIENLKKYKSECENLDMCTKYILMEKLNDTKEEIDNFLMKSQYAGADRVQMDIDYNKFMYSSGARNYVPKHFYELFEYFKEQSELKKLNPFIWEYTQCILDKGYFE